ncbi:MAG TPA: FecR domain-containing protein [Ramlibacter sp.]|jgi:hypothetical protein
MKRTPILSAALVAGLSLLALSSAHAQVPVATITQLTGQVMAIKPDGRPRILSTASRVQAGDTLVSEDGSYVKVRLDNGRQVVLGPSTTLRVTTASAEETALVLVGGEVQVTGGPGHRFTLAAGTTLVEAGDASFTASYGASRDAAVARREAYVRSSLAALATAPASDGAGNLPLGQVIAQLSPPPPLRSNATVPGLFVQVVTGTVLLSNASGSMNFTNGQFGFVGSPGTPPAIVPSLSAIRFSPPPTFAINPAGTSRPTPEAVDCEVR